MPIRVILSILLLPSLVLAEPLSVFTSVLPLKTFVERLGGERVAVQSVVQPGFSPHTYEPTPRQLGELSGATLYLRSGLPFEDAWMPRFSSANPDMQVIDARTGIELRDLEHHVHDDDGHGDGHGHHDGHDHGHHNDHGHEEKVHAESELDPHVWTNPVLVKRMATTILDALVELDPANAPGYRQNHADFVAELDLNWTATCGRCWIRFPGASSWSSIRPGATSPRPTGCARCR
jgi:zinc transport system substrate-binding protein